MEISRLNNSFNNTSSKTVSRKHNGDTQINGADMFKNEVLNWQEKIKKKINKDLKNDQEENIMMSEKQWKALMNKVDSAINPLNEDLKIDMKEDCSSEINDEDNSEQTEYKK